MEFLIEIVRLVINSTNRKQIQFSFHSLYFYKSFETYGSFWYLAFLWTYELGFSTTRINFDPGHWFQIFMLQVDIDVQHDRPIDIYQNWNGEINWFVNFSPCLSFLHLSTILDINYPDKLLFSPVPRFNVACITSWLVPILNINIDLEIERGKLEIFW